MKHLTPEEFKQAVDVVSGAGYFSLKAPHNLDYGSAEGAYWCTLRDADRTIDGVIRPLARIAETVLIYGYKPAAMDNKYPDLKTRLDQVLIPKSRGVYALDLIKDVTSGLERFWLSGLASGINVVPVIVVPPSSEGSLGPVFSVCRFMGVVRGASDGAMKSAVRAARASASDGRLSFLCRGDEIQVFAPASRTESLLQLVFQYCK